MARSIVLVSVLALLAVTCAACGARSDPAANEKPSGPIAAKVGEDVVTVGEVDGLLAEARTVFRKRGRLFPAKSDPYYADLRDEAVRYLVENTLREQFAESIGVDVAATSRSGSLDVETYRAIAQSKREGETVREALARNRKLLEEQFAQVRYSSGYQPAEHRRSLPPELRRLPKPKAKCDLKAGAYPIFEARAHGCLGPGDDEVRYFAPPCPEIPARETINPGFTTAEVESGYMNYVTSGGAGHGFFEPLTTNRGDLASEEDPEGPVCQPFPGDKIVSVGDVDLGFRPSPILPVQSPSRQ